jgi:folate-binding protein YgfZ
MSIDAQRTAGHVRGWDALQHGAVIADRTDRLRMVFSGDKAAESLTGLVTSDVVSLTPGRGQYAAALSNKGKVLADLRIFATTDGLLVDTSASAAANWSGIVKKFVNPRLAKYRDVSAETGDLGVFGSAATTMLRSVFPELALPAESYAHVTTTIDGSELMVARVPEFGADGFDIIASRQALSELRRRLVDAGAVEEATEALHIARIEAGRPEWGADMDDSMLAQEVDLDRLGAISFTKGCYTGQETVARVHYRGHVNRLLRGIRFAGDTPPSSGASLIDESGKEVGVVKSTAVSPTRGPIALALVRREVEPGAVVRARWADGEIQATVVSLPFAG